MGQAYNGNYWISHYWMDLALYVYLPSGGAQMRCKHDEQINDQIWSLSAYNHLDPSGSSPPRP